MIQEIICRAKINLYLRVTGKRPDGFHALETVFQEIDLGDRLSWNPRDGERSLHVQGMDVGPLQDNLVWRAIDAYAQAISQPVEGSFYLEKCIPAGGGLGGGSTDAASALKLLNKYYEHPLTTEQLAALALDLGSDVPFFLYGGCMLGKGRGEILEPTHNGFRPAQGFLLLPDIHLSTVEVFKAYAKGAKPKEDHGPILGENHLLPAALEVSPSFARMWEQLSTLFEKQNFFMTGSGSTCVWLTEQAEIPVDIAQSLDPLGVRVIPFHFYGVGTVSGCQE